MSNTPERTPKEGKCPPLILLITDLGELLDEVAAHAAHHRQIAVDWSTVENAWQLTVMGAKL